MGVRLAIAALVAALLVAAGLFLSPMLVGQGDEPPDDGDVVSTARQTAPSAMVRAEGVAVIALEGTVEYRRAGSAWELLRAAAPLDSHGEIRTGAASMARLRLGAAVTVELADSTEINIAQLSETLSRIRLQDGRVISEVDAAHDVRLRVQVQGTDAEAETRSGRFAVMRRGETPAVFANERGELAVAAAGQSVQLKTGEQTVVEPGAAPSPPTKITPSLLLKLGKPPPSTTRERVARITGTTAPGAVVHVGGDSTAVGSEGEFSSAVALVDGPNEIVVEVEDVLGRKSKGIVPRIVVDSSPPRIQSKVQW